MALSGTITLKGGEKIEVTDATLVGNSLSGTMSVCSPGSFDVGSFNSASIQLKIYDDEALEHEFDGAEIALTVVETKEEEMTTTPLGIYYVDGNKTKRHKNVVQLYAQDATSKFDVEIGETIKATSYTPYNAILAACEAAGVALSTTSLSEFPNNLIVFTPSSASVQTLRDLVMWAAQLVCANAVINRDGELEIRRVRYIAEGGAGSSIIADYESDGSDRVNIVFSDVRTYVKYLSSYSGNTPKEYTSNVNPSDAQARQGSLSLMKNPLVETLSTETQDEINEEILEYIDTFAPRTIKAQMFFNPSIKLGDTIRFSGGLIDVRRTIVGVVTSISWKYHGIMTINCSAPTAAKEVA